MNYEEFIDEVTARLMSVLDEFRQLIHPDNGDADDILYEIENIIDYIVDETGVEV